MSDAPDFGKLGKAFKVTQKQRINEHALVTCSFQMVFQTEGEDPEAVHTAFDLNATDQYDEIDRKRRVILDGAWQRVFAGRVMIPKYLVILNRTGLLVSQNLDPEEKELMSKRCIQVAVHENVFTEFPPGQFCFVPLGNNAVEDGEFCAYKYRASTDYAHAAVYVFPG